MKGGLLVYQSFIHGVSEQISNQIGCPKLPLACVIYWVIYIIYIIYAGPLSCILGCNNIVLYYLLTQVLYVASWGVIYYLRGPFKLHLGV